MTSAFAYAALRIENGQPESQLFEHIVNIPHYQTINFLRLLDSEDSKLIVEENMKKFQDIYNPILKEQFNDYL